MGKPKFEDGGIIPKARKQELILRGEKVYELVDACFVDRKNGVHIAKCGICRSTLIEKELLHYSTCFREDLRKLKDGESLVWCDKKNEWTTNKEK